MKHVQSNKEVATSKLESPLLRNIFTEVWKISRQLYGRAIPGFISLVSFIYIPVLIKVAVGQEMDRKKSSSRSGKTDILKQS